MSRLTVYRWELPDGAAEARRPRGAIARRLASLAPVPTAGEIERGPSSDELTEVLPLLERLLQGDFRTVEAELVPLLAGGALRSASVRALAAQALARDQLWSRGDFLGATATLLPLLTEADAGRLSPSVELEVRVTAALLFSSFDGRLFDPGKVNAQVARAERLVTTTSSEVPRFLLWLSQLLSAYVLNDGPLIELVLERGATVSRDLQSPVLRCFALEARLIESYFAQRPVAAAHHVQELLALTGARPFPLFHVRALSQAARHQIDEGEDPGGVRAICRRAEETAREAGLAPGLHLLFTAYADGEAAFRLGRHDEAEAAWRAGMRAADELQWSWGTLPFFLIRSALVRGRAGEVRAIVEQATATRCRVYAEVTRALHEALRAIAELVDGAASDADRAGDAGKHDAVERLDEAVRRLETHNAWSFLRRSMVLANAAAAIFAGSAAQAERALRHAERAIDLAPAGWARLAARALRGLFLARRGEHGAASVELAAAADGLETIGDATHAALTRALRAQLDGSDGDDVVERVLVRAGLTPISLPPPWSRASSPRTIVAPAPRSAGRRRHDGGLSMALAALEPLAARGVAADAIQRALVAALAVLFPGSAIRLEEIDSRGERTPLARAGGGQAPDRWIEFGDGSGRRLRVGANPIDDEGQALVAHAAALAGLALEVAALRGLAVAPPGAGEVPSDGDVPPAPELPGFIAASPSMRRLKGELARLGRSRATVIIGGESGSGKEVVARAIHELSSRAGKPYVAFNCAAVPRELFEGQLFGYRRGAFTGAAADQPGVIRAAHGGTLFLDEIGELPLDVQPKLLRFLENGEVFPLGVERPVRVDVRVIAATYRDLEALVREGRFREDLFYRLQVVPVRVPPLRERPEDIVALAHHFVRALTPPGEEPPVLGPDALQRLAAHPWPGNVRELRNVLERTLAYEPRPRVLGAAHLRLR